MVLLLENYELLGNSNKKENGGDNFLLIDNTEGPCSWYQYNCVHHSYSPPDKPKNNTIVVTFGAVTILRET